MAGMALIPAILALTFVALCLWLTLRIYNRRERRAKFMVAWLPVLPVIYVLSFLPACWMARRGIIWPKAVAHTYRPVIMAIWKMPTHSSSFQAVNRYAGPNRDGYFPDRMLDGLRFEIDSYDYKVKNNL